MRLFPDKQKQADIKFIFLKSLPYGKRIKLIMVLFVTGFLGQLLLNFWLGVVFLAVGTALGLINGYNAKTTPSGGEKWSQVTPDEYQKIKLKQKQLKKWDLDVFDITNPLGLFVFITIAALFFAGYIYLDIIRQSTLAKYMAINGLIIFLPLWISGVRNFLTKDKLIIKIELLEKIMMRLSTPSDIQALPMLSVVNTKNGGNMPNDARLLVRFVNAPDYFLGMQVQISINDVQGRFYPYLYCVLLAKEGERLFEKKASFFIPIPGTGIVTEQTKSDDVDVLVIRQHTTKTSGYYTNPAQALSIVQQSILLARKLIK